MGYKEEQIYFPRVALVAVAVAVAMRKQLIDVIDGYGRDNADNPGVHD